MDAVEGVVAGVALHQIVETRLETVGVEQTRDTRAGHAAPVVVIVVEQVEQDSHLGVTCGMREGAGDCTQAS